MFFSFPLHTHVHTHTRMHTHTHTHTNTHKHTQTHTYTHTHKHTHAHKHMHTHTHTQKSLHPRTQQEIIRELRTPDRLREALDVVDIVLGFLSTGGGRADQSLGKYINNTLKMKRRPFSEKVFRNL